MFLKKREFLFFGLIFLLNLIPLFSGKYFITFDGPAHLYNANIINSLFLDKQSFYHEYYIWNSQPVPNWTGHFILSFFGYFFPSFVAEKILMIIYSFALCYGFRYLIKVVSKKNLFLSYLIFPFVYMFFFFMGFYNFLLGLGLMFFAIGVFVKLMNDGWTLKNSSTLITLLFLLYFSHPVTLAVFIIFAALYFSIELVKVFSAKKHEVKRLLHNGLVTLAIGSIPFFLLVRYFYLRPETVNNTFMSNTELQSYLIEMNLLAGLNYSIEGFYTKLFLYLLITLLLIGVIYKIKGVKKNVGVRSQLLKLFKGWPFIIFLISILMIFFYFMLPFSDSLASYINTRFLLLFFLFLIIWMSSFRYPLLVKIVTIVLVFYIGFNLNNYYFDSNKEIRQYPEEIVSLSKKIPEKSVVLPLNFFNHWMFAHFSNFLGVERDIIILENYECAQNYFPLKWNRTQIPNLLINDKMSSEFDCLNWQTNNSNQSKNIDFIFIIGRKENTEKSICQEKINNLLSEHFKLIEKKGLFELYKAK